MCACDETTGADARDDAVKGAVSAPHGVYAAPLATGCKTRQGHIVLMLSWAWTYRAHDEEPDPLTLPPLRTPRSDGRLERSVDGANNVDILP
jgi:hypothetical protein